MCAICLFCRWFTGRRCLLGSRPPSLHSFTVQTRTRWPGWPYQNAFLFQHWQSRFSWHKYDMRLDHLCCYVFSIIFYIHLCSLSNQTFRALRSALHSYSILMTLPYTDYAWLVVAPNFSRASINQSEKLQGSLSSVWMTSLANEELSLQRETSG